MSRGVVYIDEANAEASRARLQAAHARARRETFRRQRRPSLYVQGDRNRRHPDTDRNLYHAILLMVGIVAYIVMLHLL